MRFCLLLLAGWFWGLDADRSVFGGESPAARFNVSSYVVAGYQVPPTNALTSVFSKYTGANVSLNDIVTVASAVQSDYRNRGYTNISISIAAEKITNGIVTLHVFRTPSGDIFISGKPFNATNSPALAGKPAPSPSSEPAERPKPTPLFAVKTFEVIGGTLLSEETLKAVLSKHTGTNVAISNIVLAASSLQQEYRSRGYPTVRVTIPQQQITNQIVKLQVFEGRLSEISVTKNRFFSSNNVMRALPSLQTNMILNSATFQAELDRANANQDRQIYPQIAPGAEENTTVLTLETKDRFPLHGKIEFNNQNSHGTPDLRVNTSAAYNNLWQREHSLGVQYAFSPEIYKSGNQWNFYDLPEVANYGAFYRMPWGDPAPIADLIASSPGRFGYDEASRTFRLPPPSGRPELNFYASRSTIDTGVMTIFSGNLYNTNGNSLDRRDTQQDVTINNALGSRFSLPLKSTEKFQSTLSFGPDFKAYDLTSRKTNTFILTSVQIDYGNDPSHPQTNITRQVAASPVPTTRRQLDYLPLTIRYDASWRDALGITTFGIGLSANSWISSSASDLQMISGSAQSSDHWIVLTPSLGRDFVFRTNWVLSLRAAGQWADQPLISNEQLGLGGLGSIRGYQEGEVYGDTGWHTTLEQKTPYYVVGTVHGNHPLTVRGSVYMGYGEVYLNDPAGRDAAIPLWGAGFGGVASIGANWETRLFFSWPLLSSPTTPAGQPRFDFSLTAQF